MGMELEMGKKFSAPVYVARAYGKLVHGALK